MIPAPFALSSAILRNNPSTSWFVIAEVGSSMTMMFASCMEVAFRISSIWMSETDRCLSGVSGA